MYSGHGVFMMLYGRGVLITGKPGIGKSQLALALLDRGHHLIADDLVILTEKSKGKIWGKSVESYQGFLAVRDVGIFDINQLYPPQVAKSAPLALIVELFESPENFENTDNHDIHTVRSTTTILACQFPTYKISAQANRPLALLLECIVRRDLLAHR
jgi:HPr kinase/phosphorylase